MKVRVLFLTLLLLLQPALAETNANTELQLVREKLQNLQSYSLELQVSDKSSESGELLMSSQTQLKMRRPNLLHMQTRGEVADVVLEAVMVFDGSWQWVDTKKLKEEKLVQRTIHKVSAALAPPKSPFKTGYHYSGTGLTDGLDYIGTFVQILELYDLEFTVAKNGYRVYSGDINREKVRAFLKSQGKEFLFERAYPEGKKTVQIHIFIDARTHLPMGFSQGDDPGKPDYFLQVSKLKINPIFPDGTFTYEAPSRWAVFDSTKKAIAGRKMTEIVNAGGGVTEAISVYFEQEQEISPELDEAISQENVAKTLGILKVKPELFWGADVVGQTAVHYLTRFGSLEGLKLAKKHGADLSAPGYGLRTPLHIAMELKSPSRDEIIQFLIASKVKLEARDYFGNTPLHLAPNQEIYDWLTEAGAKNDPYNTYGQVPRDLLQEKLDAAEQEAARRAFEESLRNESKGGVTNGEVVFISGSPATVESNRMVTVLADPTPNDPVKTRNRLFLGAVEQGDLRAVTEGLDGGIAPGEPLKINLQGQVLKLSPIQVAAASNLNSLKILVERRKKSSGGDFAREVGACLEAADSADIAQFLLDSGADPTTKLLDSASLLHAKLRLDVMKVILKSGLDPNLTDNKGFTPLTKLWVEKLRFGQSSVDFEQRVEALLQAGANIDARFDLVDRESFQLKGMTLLHLAILRGRIEDVSQLLELGADSKLATSNGWTALHVACTSGKMDIVRELLKRKPDIDARGNDSGWTPLHTAVFLGRAETIAFLLEQGAKVNFKDKAGNTPLHLAAHLGKRKAAELLLKSGANPRGENLDGETPLDVLPKTAPPELKALLK